MIHKKVFVRTARTMFRVFKDAVHSAIYHTVKNTGFEEDDKHTDVQIIAESFSERDIAHSPFSELIQPLDVKGLVMGEQLKFPVNSQVDKIEIKYKDGTSEIFTVISYTTDAMKVMYTFLLRKT